LNVMLIFDNTQEAETLEPTSLGGPFTRHVDIWETRVSRCRVCTFLMRCFIRMYNCIMKITSDNEMNENEAHMLLPETLTLQYF